MNRKFQLLLSVLLLTILLLAVTSWAHYILVVPEKVVVEPG